MTSDYKLAFDVFNFFIYPLITPPPISLFPLWILQNLKAKYKVPTRHLSSGM